MIFESKDRLLLFVFFLFIHLVLVFLSGGGRRSNKPKKMETPRDQQRFKIVLLAPYEDGAKQGWRLVTSPGLWTTSGRFRLGVGNRTYLGNFS